MTKIKSTLIEALKSSYLPLIIFAVIVAIYHTTLPILFADDAWFYNILEGKDNHDIKFLEPRVDFFKRHESQFDTK